MPEREDCNACITRFSRQPLIVGKKQRSHYYQDSGGNINKRDGLSHFICLYAFRLAISCPSQSKGFLGFLLAVHLAPLAKTQSRLQAPSAAAWELECTDRPTFLNHFHRSKTRRRTATPT